MLTDVVTDRFLKYLFFFGLKLTNIFIIPGCLQEETSGTSRQGVAAVLVVVEDPAPLPELRRPQNLTKIPNVVTNS